MPITTAEANAQLDAYFATTRYMSLHTATPGAAGSYSGEVTTVSTNYVRQSLAGKMSAASGGLVTNTATISFPTIAAVYGVVTAFAVGSAASAGTMGLYALFDNSSLKAIGQAYQFPAGTLRFAFR